MKNGNAKSPGYVYCLSAHFDFFIDFLQKWEIELYILHFILELS